MCCRKPPSLPAAFAAAAALALTAAGALPAQTSVSVDGIIESTSGGLRFPDGSVQTRAVEVAPGAVDGTGGAGCFNAAGVTRSCPFTGEDGEHRAGVDWSERRFFDRGDGTIDDRLTGLMWLKDADCVGGKVEWQAALTWVGVTLNFSPLVSCTDYTAGTHQDWRLPNVKELESLVDYGASNPALPPGHPFANANPGQIFYWSSTSTALDRTQAWVVNLGLQGNNFTLDKDGSTATAWAVRGGVTNAGGLP